MLTTEMHNLYTFFLQTRVLLTSIATNNIATGLLVTIWNAYPSLTSCWPYGILLCQIQVLDKFIA